MSKTILVLCLAMLACGFYYIENASAYLGEGESDDYGGYVDDGNPGSTNPTEYQLRVSRCGAVDLEKTNGNDNTDYVRRAAKCAGYSWMFFMAIGPNYNKYDIQFSPTPMERTAYWEKDENGNPTKLIEASYNIDTIKEPTISGECINEKYPSSGFWHFGPNGLSQANYPALNSATFSRGQLERIKCIERGYWQNGEWKEERTCKIGQSVVAYRNYSTYLRERVGAAYDFNKATKAGSITSGGESVYFNFGHTATWNSEIKGKNKYAKEVYEGNMYTNQNYSLEGIREMEPGTARIFKQSLDLLNKGWDEAGVYNRRGSVDSNYDRGQVLYKRISDNNKDDNKEAWVPVYIAVGTKSSDEVLHKYYQPSYRIEHNTENAPTKFPDKMYYFCSWHINEKTLTLVPVDERGNDLSKSVSWTDGDWTKKAQEKTLASVTRGTNDRYVFLGFKLAASARDIPNEEFVTTTNEDDLSYVSGAYNETFNVKSLEDDMTVYAVYEEKSSFLGQIQLLEGTTQKAAVGYSDKTLPTVTYNINNCSPTDGCKVTFVHNFQRKSGDKTVTYTITRDSNYYVSNQGRGVESKTLVNNATENFAGVNNNTTKQIYKDEEMVSHPLYPGQVVCETLSFKPFVWKDDSVTLTLCASALGNAQPNDPADPGNPDNTGTPWDDPDGDNDNLNGASAFLKIEVKNESVSRYGTYRKIVYAKPNDKIKYRVTYNPILQYTAYLKPQQMRIDGGSNIYINTSSQYLKDLFKDNKGSLNDWNNAFYVGGVISNNYNSKCSNGECKYEVGVFTKQSEESNSVFVQPGDVRRELKETAVTNQTNNVKTTPSQVEFTSNGDAKYNLGNVITNQKTSEALVRVPYNFDISVCMKKAQNDTECAGSDLGVFDAGAGKSLYFEVDVNKKENSQTTNNKDEAYATIVPKAITKIIIYKGTAQDGDLVEDVYDICAKKYGLNADGFNCKYSEVNEWEDNNALNAGGALEGIKKTLPATFDVPDMEAGASYCVAAAVYPASSADVNAANYATDSTGWKDEEGNHMWRVSDSVCFTVGKKPTFQVWGGSFYGGGKITVSSTTKNNLTLPSGNITISNGTLVFSSWVEQTVVAEKEVEKLASGAATGLVFNNDKNKAEGGSLENPESFCKYRVPLSIANYGSGLCQEDSGNLTGNSNIIVNTNKKIFTEIATEGVERISVDGDYSTPNYPMIVSKGTTRIIEATGKVTINGSIEYENTSYSSLAEIPKMVIYAKGDIEINCNVTRIDAILLADGTIYSCGTYTGKGTVTDYNEALTRTNLLTVNGAIFTKQLELGRTYGMGTGTYSKIPAEIVNYDSSIILWAKGKSDTDDFEKMYQVYQHEMAPRY